AYDRLNMWGEYLYLFETSLREKRHIRTYGAERDDPVFNSYVLGQDSRFKYVHFLYICDWRYKIIQRKYERSGAGKSVEHLKRHQQDQLEEAELNSRYMELKRLFESISANQA
ncbi:MAG: hypothetical protein FWH06_04330, partial [Oscillospiraceae bacterium]|nr:hypothetical protein [Oscillospiraceae bacterium]